MHICACVYLPLTQDEVYTWTEYHLPVSSEPPGADLLVRCEAVRTTFLLHKQASNSVCVCVVAREVRGRERGGGAGVHSYVVTTW